MRHEQLVVLGLALAVDEDVRSIAIGAEEQGFAIYLFGRGALDVVDGLEEGVRDAVGAADKLDVGCRGIPFWSDGVYNA